MALSIRAHGGRHILENLRVVVLPLVVFVGCFELAFVSGSFFLLPSASEAASQDVVVSLDVSSVLAMSMNTDSLNVDITPVGGGMVVSGDVTATVSTNNQTGYTLSMNATGAGNVDLVHTNGTNMINNSSNTTAGSLAVNTWGYNKKTGTTPTTFFRIPLPTSPDVLLTTTSPSTNEATTVTVAGNADTSIPAGTYASQLTFTAVANYVPEPLEVPDGANPTNISGTNPAVRDVYPTTGWAGDVVAITSNGLFTNVTSVTVGGTDCMGYNVVSSSVIACRLPAKAAGTTNDIAVINNGTDVVSAGTYNNMRVTYFDPSATTVNIGGTNYNFYANGFSSANCNAMTASNAGMGSTPAAAIAYVRDARNNQTYRVKKMVDGKCWMVDNLKYVNTTIVNTADNTTGMTYNNGDHRNNGGNTASNTVDESSSQSMANSDKAFYNNPMGHNYCYGIVNMPGSALTRCGYLYNWYAATDGAGGYSVGTTGVNVGGDICPANFRLPSSQSDGVTAMGTGLLFGVADLPVLNASMNAGVLTAGVTTTTFYAGWQPGGAWGGVFSGAWLNALSNQSVYGNFWSATAYSNANARVFGFNSSSVDVGSGSGVKYSGRAVRCVMGESLVPPAGSNPSNISSTNPAVLDVYPTTGWGGDVVAISSNALFTDVTDVTIGGTVCTEWDVVTESLVTCKLPAKVAGTANDIVVMNNGTNVTPVGTYTHMRVTYFDPSAATVTISNTTYDFYPNGFTSSNCSGMTASNDPIGSTPATALAYVRDTRNKQTYKVKKMVDNKCWMVDNLKYISTTSPSNVDNTTGMTYNQGDHLGNGGTNAYNTIDETTTQSTTNSDKAFFNNPMSTANCYSSTYMPNNTLTHCGYLYNWYAATNGTGTYSQSTQGNNVIGNICPANFRLPSAMSDGTTPTGNGTSYNAADFAVLNASMNAGTLITGSTTSYPAGWQPSGSWGESFAGDWSDALYSQGSGGRFWSSTVASATVVRILYFSSGGVNPGGATYNKRYGYAVRCVLP